MGRELKYSKELKLEIVNRYLNGESACSLSNKYDMPNNTGHTYILEWVHKYQVQGDKAFDHNTRNKSYSKKLKEKVIKEYLSGKETIRGVMNKYNISSSAVVRRWIFKYNNGIVIKDYNPKGEIYTMKSRSTTFEERLEIVNYVLSHDNDYKGAADKYSVPYANVFNWVKKYNERGEDGLHDFRGRPSINGPKKELSDLDKKDIEIEKLKKELERSKMVIEVLKKNIEIQEQIKKDSRKLGKKTNTKQ